MIRRWLFDPLPLHRWVIAGGYSPRRMFVFVLVRVVQIVFLIGFLVWLWKVSW